LYVSHARPRRVDGSKVKVERAAPEISAAFSRPHFFWSGDEPHLLGLDQLRPGDGDVQFLSHPLDLLRSVHGKPRTPMDGLAKSDDCVALFDAARRTALRDGDRRIDDQGVLGSAGDHFIPKGVAQAGPWRNAAPDYSGTRLVETCLLWKLVA